MVAAMLTAAAAVLAPLAAQDRPAVRVEPRPGKYPIEDADGVGEQHQVVCRVVDGITGEPLPNAELLLVEERKAPCTGKHWFTYRLAADAEGFVRVRDAHVQGREHWLHLRAPGYGTAGAAKVPPDVVWALSPGIDVPIEVRDWLDRPVPDAGVGYCLGCGHTPDVAFATSDARGMAVLRGIDPHTECRDLYPLHPRLSVADYDSLLWRAGDLPYVLRPPAGRPVSGRVVDARGAPLAGAFVGAPVVHRGPWTEVRADGTFELWGVTRQAGPDLFVVRGEREVVFGEPGRRPPIVLRFPDGDDKVVDPEPLPDGPRGTLRLVVHGDRGGPLPEGFTWTAFGPLPVRWPVEGAAGEDEQSGDALVVEAPLLAGTWELHVRPAWCREVVTRVEVAPGGRAQCAIAARPLPSARVVVEGAPGGAGFAVLVRQEGEEKPSNVTLAVLEGEDLPLPAGPLAFMVHGEGSTRVVPVDPDGVRDGEPLTLRWFAPTTVRGRVVDEAGAPVAATLALVPGGRVFGDRSPFDLRACERPARTRADGAFSLEARCEGLAFLAVVPEDARLPPRLVACTLPRRGDGDVVFDAGMVALPAAPRLRVVTAAGAPAAEAGIGRVGWHDVREPEPTFALDARGGWLGPDPRAGDAIVVPASRRELEPTAERERLSIFDVPARTVLRGEGPWTVTVPAGQVLLEVRNARGEPLAARVRVFVRDYALVADGRALLRQLPPGPLVLHLAAEGHEACAVYVDVPAQGVVTAPVTLREQ